MAQWGQGDARWIVEHRDDGKNVNGWHWEEKNVLSQVKQRLMETFQQVPVDLGGPASSLTITSCKSVEGEASLTTRKGNKRLCVYDLKLTIEWEMTVEPSQKQVKGTMSVQEFASASEEDDYLFEVSTTSSGADEDAAKKLMEGAGKQEVVRRLLALAKELQEL